MIDYCDASMLLHSLSITLGEIDNKVVCFKRPITNYQLLTEKQLQFLNKKKTGKIPAFSTVTLYCHSE